MRNFFINGIEWSKAKVTQNENGVYYKRKSGGLWGTYLRNFDNATLPEGVTKHYDGSHRSRNYLGVNIFSQRAIDISGPKLSPITCDTDVKVLGVYGSGAQKYGVVGSGKKIFGVPRWQDFLVHTTKWAKPGTIVKAGRPICYVYKDHVHLFTKRFGVPYPIRSCILAKD